MLKEAEKSVSTKDKVTFVAIACCTFQRQAFLERTLMNLANLEIPENIRVEVVVVDNDKDASAKNVVDKLTSAEAGFPFKINYFVEEKRGLSNARNKLLSEIVNLGASHVAIFDDDGLVDSKWLWNHISLYNENPNGKIISGPEFAYFDGEFPSFLENNNIFVHSTTKKKGEVRNTCASNNSFFPVSIVSRDNIWFDPEFVFMGGEDGDFFSRASKAGYEIVFNPDAIVREIADKSRVNLKWILHRSWYNGYSGSYLKFKKNDKPFRRMFYILKMFIVVLFDVVLLPLTVIGGLTIFFNTAGLLCKNFGKLLGAILLKPVDYYRQLNGGIK